jgi:hypothetical protein
MMLAGAILILLSIGTCLVIPPDISPSISTGDRVMSAISTMLLVAGGALFVVGRIGGWWHHG